MVKLDSGAGQAIKAFLSEHDARGAVRIELRSTGCCDPSLGLLVDTVRESDLVEEVDGITFIVSPETHDLAGEITVSHRDDRGEEGFVLTSANPIGEWAGFGTCSIEL